MVCISILTNAYKSRHNEYGTQPYKKRKHVLQVVKLVVFDLIGLITYNVEIVYDRPSKVTT